MPKPARSGEATGPSARDAAAMRQRFVQVSQAAIDLAERADLPMSRSMVMQLVLTVLEADAAWAESRDLVCTGDNLGLATVRVARGMWPSLDLLLPEALAARLGPNAESEVMRAGLQRFEREREPHYSKR